MEKFEDLKIKKQLLSALGEMGLERPTPIQQESYSTILGGRDFVGIAQTGTGKTLAFLLPILQDLRYSEQSQPRVLIFVPTRELVIQIVEEIEKLTAYMTVRTLGVYGGTNINTQKQAIAQGLDIIVGTPRRLYDLALTEVLRLKSIKKLVIDEVDIMLDFGYKTQLNNLFEYLPQKRQNILFSATMTNYVAQLVSNFLVNPVNKTLAVSGTPLENIRQEAYAVPNFHTKANLLNYLLQDKETHGKVLVFAGSRIVADRLYENLDFQSETSLIHAKKEQNYRTRSIEEFASGKSRILIATDVISRGIDIEKISTVVSFNTPLYPENYIHRIGRTGRAGERGRAILLHSEQEKELKDAIETLMNYTIPPSDLPEEVEISTALAPEEKINPFDQLEEDDTPLVRTGGASFHEKSAKNSKEKPKEKAYHRKLKAKYKKPQKRGDKIQNIKKKRKKR